MKGKYSRVYKAEGKKFRYNYEESRLEWISDVDKQTEELNAEWMKDFGKPMFDIVDGYVLGDSIGLSEENWKESPAYWCEQYAYEISEECSYEAQFI